MQVQIGCKNFYQNYSNMKQVILVEHSNGKYSIEQDKPTPNIFIRKWMYARITEEQLEELKIATKEKTQIILRNLSK